MICCCIKNKSARQIAGLLDKVEMAEIRLDLCDLTDDEIEAVFSSDTPLVATCRASDGDFRRTEHLLTLAIKAGARYADLEIETPKPVSKRIAAACAEWGTTFIRSYHNFTCTPSLDELKAAVDKCRLHDGEIVKIATMAMSEDDAARISDLYGYYSGESLIAFAMGPAGVESRMECLRRGAPFSYAALSEDEATAEGQMAYEEMYGRVYGDFRFTEGRALRMPASKSYAQRAIMAASLAHGTSVLRGYTPCGDSESAVAVAAAAGASVIRKRGKAGTSTLEICGTGGKPRPTAGVNVGESGLLARLAMPLCCTLFPGWTRIDGEGTLLRRPLQGAENMMEALGGSVRPAGTTPTGTLPAGTMPGPSGNSDAAVPLEVKGPLRAGNVAVDGSKSSQLVSGALMALPLCGRDSTLHVKNPVSIPYMFITSDILRKFGIKIRSEMYGDGGFADGDWDGCDEIVFRIKGGREYKAAEFDIEGDWSAAAVFLAAGAVFGRVEIGGLDTSSLQADLSVMDILVEAGASISQAEGQCGAISVQRSPLSGFKADLTNCPDLFPVVAVLCAFCQGRSSLKGVGRLVHKESDRAEGIVEMLRKMGVSVMVRGDEMSIVGENLTSRIMNGRLLKGGSYSSRHDHRMVMALRLASLGASSPVVIDDENCVSKSFPRFCEVWKSLES